MNELEKAVKSLKEYVSQDIIYQNKDISLYKAPSDFDLFCISHCEDIETVLQALKDSIPKETIRDFIKSNACGGTYNFRTVEVSKLEELIER